MSGFSFSPMPKKILIEVDDKTVKRLVTQAKACGRSVTAQATHLVATGAISDPVTPLVVALKNVSDRAVPCVGNKNHIVPSYLIRAVRKTLGVK